MSTAEQTTTEPRSTRRRAEPAGVIDALNLGATTPDELEARWIADYGRNRDGWHEPGVCRWCGGEIPRPWVIQSGPMIFAITSCEPCVERGQERHQAEQVQAQQADCARWIPPEYNVAWDSTKGNDALRARVLQYSIADRRNLCLHGESGRGKTRCVWELLKHLASVGALTGFIWLDAFDLANQGIPAGALTTPYLVIDDLGNEPLNQKTETALLHLIKKRLEWRRPTFITTQLDGKAFAQRFRAEHTANAILRRLNERTDFVAATPAGAAPRAA